MTRSIKIHDDAFGVLVEEARSLGVQVQDLVSDIVMKHLGVTEEDTESEEEETEGEGSEE